MAEKKVKSDSEAYKSKGRKLNQASQVGKPESERLSEGQGSHDCANGNDGSSSQPSAPENKHKLMKYS